MTTEHSEKALDLALGIDIGGTFTDLSLVSRADGRQWIGKVLTNNADLARGVLDGVNGILEQSGINPDSIASFVHGTTLATNALIERRGASTALVVTRGFRDILQFARESRYDIYDINIEIPRPLVPPFHVFEVTERLDARGNVIAPLDHGEMERIAAELKEANIKSVAVCFLHAYLNAEHEQIAGEILAQTDPELSISLSSSVIPDIREYERANTTAANAYVQPAVRGYLNRLEAGLRKVGLVAPLSMMTSDGGTISLETAAQFPVRIVESGPAGGALAASFFGSKANLDKVIAFDVGGTTAKVAVIDDGEPERSTEFEFARIERFAKGSGLPLKVPSIELIEVGAGGGSIAHLDELGLLKVGPQSASSDPGPVCYSLGGIEPTVTDADVYLGYIDPDAFLGGHMRLDRAAAERAIAEKIAKPLGLSVTRAAWGIYEVVGDTMARAAKVHCLERGKDMRDYTLVGYGGAGPVHAYHVAASLGIGRVLFPPHAGVLSAFGFLTAAPAFELLHAYPVPLEEMDFGDLDDIYAEMGAKGRELLESSGVADADMEFRRQAALRYAGQSFDLVIDLPADVTGVDAIDAIRERFLDGYRDRYRQVNPKSPIEFVNCRVVVSGPRPSVAVEQVASDPNAAVQRGVRQVYVPEVKDFVSCPVYDRAALSEGFHCEGPAVFEEPESTAFVGAGAKVEILPGNILSATLPTPDRAGLVDIGAHAATEELS